MRQGVIGRVRTTRSGLARVGAASAITIVMALAAVSCGDESDQETSGTASGTNASVADGSAAPGGGGDGGDVVTGEQLSRSAGCAGCHGANFGGGAGPGWVGLAGSERTLADGTVVVADTAYLTRSIAEPSAELVADYTLRMPANNLTDAEIADVVAFIETLADE